MMLTFEGSNPGILVSSVTPTPEALTINQHHSFVALPDSNFKPRYLILDRDPMHLLFLTTHTS